MGEVDSYGRPVAPREVLIRINMVDDMICCLLDKKGRELPGREPNISNSEIDLVTNWANKEGSIRSTHSLLPFVIPTRQTEKLPSMTVIRSVGLIPSCLSGNVDGNNLVS